MKKSLRSIAITGSSCGIDGSTNMSYYFGTFDENGKPVERTLQSHPYSYDGFVTWRGGKNAEVNETVYSDRIIHEPRFNELATKHFGNSGQMYGSRNPSTIEAFLKELYNSPKLKLIYIMNYCNKSDGNPYWRFEINLPKK